MSGWKIDSPKYKITEALFHEIWESLEIIADVDKDGKITKTEWVSWLNPTLSNILSLAKKFKIRFFKNWYVKNCKKNLDVLALFFFFLHKVQSRKVSFFLSLINNAAHDVENL